MLLALLTLTACLPAPDPDWSLGDSGEAPVDGIEFSGKLFNTTETGKPPEEVVVGLIHFAQDDNELAAGETIQVTAPLAMPSASAPADYELVLPQEPDGEQMFAFEEGLDGAPFLVVAWEETGKDDGFDEDDVLVGTSPTVLVYLQGELSAELQGDGLQEGWNQMDLSYWLGGPPTSVGPLEDGASGINLDSNLLPELPESLSGTIELPGDGGYGDGHEDLMVAAVSTKGFCGPPAGIELEALSTTGTTGRDFNFAQWPGLANFDDWETNDVIHECEDVPEERLVDGAVFYLVAYLDLDGDRGFDAEADYPFADSSGAGEASSFLMYMKPRSPLAYLYTLGGANMGWSRGSYEDGSTLPWHGAVIGTDWKDEG